MSAPPQFAALARRAPAFSRRPDRSDLGAEGDRGAVAAAYAAAERRFATILDELCAELPLLRAPGALAGRAAIVAQADGARCGAVCSRRFITPMAAVAGAVAEEVLQAMTAHAALRRAYVNNGGDIALHLRRGRTFYGRHGRVAPTIRPCFGRAHDLQHRPRAASRPRAGAAAAFRSASPTPSRLSQAPLRSPTPRRRSSPTPSTFPAIPP